MNVAKAHPLLELRFTDREKFTRAFEIEIAAEIIDSRKLFFDSLTDRANQQLVWDFNAQHIRYSLSTLTIRRVRSFMQTA